VSHPKDPARNNTPGYGAVLCILIAALIPGCVSSPRFLSAKPLSSSGSGDHQLSGVASYYADEFNGRTTASGETFDMNDLTAAHRTLPFNTTLRVHNQANGKEVTVRINDRGPFKDDRVIDLSLEAAKRIDLMSSGTAPVLLEIIEIGAPSAK